MGGEPWPARAVVTRVASVDAHTDVVTGRHRTRHHGARVTRVFGPQPLRPLRPLRPISLEGVPRLGELREVGDAEHGLGSVGEGLEAGLGEGVGGVVDEGLEEDAV
jgi:hypothetical protein